MTDDTLRVEKGRGAPLNLEGRFAREARTREDDGWGILDEPLPPLETTVQADAARSIISRNESPDVGFSASVNPYRGCESGCVYCVDENTPILRADGSYSAIKDLETGARIIGTERDGFLRKYVETRVLNKWSSIKPAYRIKLGDGTEIVASGDHRFLTERGWKFVTGREQGAGRRPFLTPNNKLMGFGAFAPRPLFNREYKRGYLAGMIRGDGSLGTYRYTTRNRIDIQHQFRLALADIEALDRSRTYLEEFGVPTFLADFKLASGSRGRPMQAIRTSSKAAVARIRELIAWPETPCDDWRKGYVAGLFDAEGSYSHGVLRISNSDFQIVGYLCAALTRFSVPYVLEQVIKHNGLKSLTVVRVTGGLKAVMRMFQMTAPAISRKLSIKGAALRCDADLRITEIQQVGLDLPMVDITTGTGDFIANGVVAHNCFARPTHAYLDLSPGIDFETKLFYKPNAAELLRAAFNKPGYQPTPIALGINTDGYQPIERKYGITRACLEVMRDFRHPVAIVTKHALVTRDLDLLTDLARDDLVQVMFSVTSLDPEIKRTLEPRAAGPQARLRAMRMLADAGVPTGVMVAPVIPAITDHELEHIVAAAADAGARSAGYVMLRLPYEVKHLFRAWLDAHYPQRAAHVMSLINQVRGGRDNDPRFGSRMRGEGPFADLVRARFHAACRKHGLNRASRDNNGPRTRLRTDLFRPPPQAGDQFALFG